MKNQTRFLIIAILAALILHWWILPQFLGPSVYKLSAPVPNQASFPGSTVFGNPKARTYITAWVAPDCRYCRIWWTADLPGFLNNTVKPGTVELIVRLMPENQRDLYVEHFLACLPDNQVRQKALSDFMTEDGWQSKPIGQWPMANSITESCLGNSSEQKALLAANRDEAERYKVEATPSFAIGAEMVRGLSSSGDIGDF